MRSLIVFVVAFAHSVAVHAVTLVLHSAIKPDQAGTAKLQQLGRVLAGAKERKQLPDVVIELPTGSRVARDVVEVSIRKQLPSSIKGLQIIGPDYIRIENNARVDSGDIEDIARTVLDESLQGKLSNVSLQRLGNAPDIRVDADTLSKGNVRSCNIEYWQSRQCVWVDQYRDGKFLATTPVWFVVDASIKVLRLNADMEAKTAANAAAVHTESVSIAELRQKPVASVADVEGYRFLGSVKAGEILTQDMLGPIPDILSGDVVQVESVMGDVRILTKAISQSEGKVGEEIRLLSVSSNEQFQARIVDKGQTRVTGESYQHE